MNRFLILAVFISTVSWWTYTFLALSAGTGVPQILSGILLMSFFFLVGEKEDTIDRVILNRIASIVR